MAVNILDQLAEVEVPTPPVDFDQQLHERINHWLLAGQVADLVVRGFGYAVVQFAVAVFGMLHYSMTGTYSPDRKEESEE